MSEELKKFYKGRSKNEKLYTYDDDGNLIEKNKEGTVIKTIPLPNYRQPTLEEFDEMEETHMKAIAIANKEYEDARKELREIISKPDTLDSEVLRINRKVVEADMKLQVARFPLRFIEVDTGFEIRDIDFLQINEKRKYPYEFYLLKTRPFTLQEQYVRVGALSKKPYISVAEATASNNKDTLVILFSEPDTNEYGFLSLKWPVEINFNRSLYNSVQQAIAAELAKTFNDQDNLDKIMLAETPDEIDYELSDVPGDEDINEIKWNDTMKQLLYDINIAKFDQYPELAGRLLETKNATLGAYIPDDNLIGIGISLDNIQSKNPIYWTGQNLLGKALSDIRNKLQSDREQQQQQQPQQQSRPIRRRPKVAAVPQE
jgi:ribA/ribD-fused uncharacterized protein